MDYYVHENSIVRKVWGKSDTILFIFAGASAEFALNKAVDWLYFTGKLPADPIGRLFSTVKYARRIVFSPKNEAITAINQISSIHQGVEKSRGYKIPDWAYRDVLYMLIHYSIAAYELLERQLTIEEKEEVYHVFFNMGREMHLQQLPETYTDWLPDRLKHLEKDLDRSQYSIDLFRQYRKHLGAFRFQILLEAQKLVVPGHIGSLLKFGRIHWILPAVPLYRLSRKLKIDSLIKNLLLPEQYRNQIQALDVQTY